MKRQLLALCVVLGVGAMAAILQQSRQADTDRGDTIAVVQGAPPADCATRGAEFSRQAVAAEGPETPWICQTDQDRTGITASDNMQVVGTTIALTGGGYDVLRGLNFRAFFKTTSNAYNEDGPNSANDLSQHIYRQPMLDRAVSWHANVVRFQVSQWAMSGKTDRPAVFNQYSKCLSSALYVFRQVQVQKTLLFAMWSRA